MILVLILASWLGVSGRERAIHSAIYCKVLKFDSTVGLIIDNLYPNLISHYYPKYLVETF